MVSIFLFSVPMTTISVKAFPSGHLTHNRNVHTYIELCVIFSLLSPYRSDLGSQGPNCYSNWNHLIREKSTSVLLTSDTSSEWLSPFRLKFKSFWRKKITFSVQASTYTASLLFFSRWLYYVRSSHKIMTLVYPLNMPVLNFYIILRSYCGNYPTAVGTSTLGIVF